MKLIWLVVGVAMVGGCDKPRVAPAVPNTPAVVAVDSIRVGELYKPGAEPDLDRLRFLIDSHEALLPTADSTRRPVLLLAIGLAFLLNRRPIPTMQQQPAVS